jgi:hypothetical protein
VATAGPARRVDRLQGVHEGGELLGGAARVGDPAERPRVAVEPAVDRPPEGIALVGLARGDGLGHGQRQARRQPGQPLQLPVEPIRPPRHQREAHHQVVAQSVQGVDGAGGGDRHQRQIGPLGDVRAQEPPHEAGIDVDLALVHPRSRHAGGHASAGSADPSTGLRRYVRV